MAERPDKPMDALTLFGLFAVTAMLLCYALESHSHWYVLGFFDLKEHFAAIGLALLPAYWVCWRRPLADEPAQTRTALTSILAFIVWWGFLSGHVANNIMGFGS